MGELKPSPPNSAPLTPLVFLERAAAVYGDSPSVIYNSTTYTWEQTYQRCLKMASALSAFGIKRGQVVSVAAPNIPAMYELHFAIPMAGAILNTLNIRLEPHTIATIIQHANSKIIFVDCQSESLLLRALSLYPLNSVRPLLVFIGDGDTSIQPSSPNAFWKNYEEMILTGDPDFNWVRPDSEFDPLSLSYISGTTSSPNGVVHNHRGTFIVAMDSLIEWAVPKEPVFLWTLPMFHSSGWSYVWGMAAAGGTNICLRKFDAEAVYDAIHKHRVTHMCGAPVVLNMLCSINRKPLDNPVHVMTAGELPSAAILFRAETLGFIVTQSYGMT